MIWETYRGFIIYYRYEERANGFADVELYYSRCSTFGNEDMSLEKARKDIDNYYEEF